MLEGVLKGMSSFVSDNEMIKKNMDKLVSLIINPLINKMGWDKKNKDSHKDPTVRSLLIRLLGDFAKDDPNTLKEAKQRWDIIMADPVNNKISND